MANQMQLAAFFQMVSSALATNIAIGMGKSNSITWQTGPGFTSKFLGLSWAAVASISMALTWKIWNDALMKRRIISSTTELAI